MSALNFQADTDLAANIPLAEINKIILELIETLQRDANACELKWTLFVAAAQSYRYDSQLKPFPPFHQDGQSVNITELLSVIAQVPPLKTVLQVLLQMQNVGSRRFYGRYHKVLQLLHWNLVSLTDPSLKSIDKQNFNDILQKSQSTLPGPRPTHIFEVIPSENSALERKFQNYAAEVPTSFAFHGSKIYSFHSIMNYGLQQHLCKTAVFGEGIYLSSEMHVSLHFSPAGTGWNLSELGQELSCLAICEFVEDGKHVMRHTNDQKSTTSSQKSGNNVPEKYVIITNNEYVRLRYLVVFGQEQRIWRNAVQQRQNGAIINWIINHKSFVLMTLYATILLAIGLGNSNYNYNYLKQVLWKRVVNAFHYVKTTYFNGFNLFD